MIKNFFGKYSKAINDIIWIFGISILVLASYCIICERPWMNIDNFISYRNSLLFFLFPYIAFLPAEILIFVICKKIYSEKWKIFWSAFLIPFCNMIYFLCERIWQYFKYHSCIDTEFYADSEFLGIISLVIILPLTFFITLCIPSKKLNYKKQIIKSSALMMLLGWVLVIFSLNIENLFACVYEW